MRYLNFILGTLFYIPFIYFQGSDYKWTSYALLWLSIAFYVQYILRFLKDKKITK